MNKGGGAIGGMSLSGTLAVIFIVLKLTGLIHWSWLWVLCPFWLPTAIFVIALILALHKF